MEIQVVRRAVIGFEHGEVFLLQVTVHLVPECKVKSSE